MRYLAQFETSFGDIYQGLVHFPTEPRHWSYYPDGWFRTVERLGGVHTSVPGGTVSLRTSVRAGRLSQLALFGAPACAVVDLRNYLTAFLELLAFVEHSVELPLDRKKHDELASSWASHLCRIEPMEFRAGPVWLACDFRVLDFLPTLLEEAAAAGHNLLHQAHLQPWILTPDQERRARRNLVELERLRGVPSALLELETRLLHRPAGKVLLLEEYVGVDTPGSVSWLQQALRHHFEERFARTGFDPPAFTFVESRFSQFLRRSSPEAEAVSFGFHSALIKSPSDEEIFSSAIKLEQRRVLFDWSGSFRHWFEPPQAADRVASRDAYEQRERIQREEVEAFTAQAADQWPRIAVSNAPSGYAFISYRRTDFLRIAPLLRGLNDAGFPYWFDRGIPGGSQWMSVLQERLCNARALILFVSQDAVQSRYVQIEVYYAHSIAKPILPVRLDYLELKNLPGGLGLILGSLQGVNAQLEQILCYLRQGNVISMCSTPSETV